MEKVVIDFEKMKDPYSGLGQYCLFLKDQFDIKKAGLSFILEYFAPVKNKVYRYFSFLLPYSEIFHAIHQDSPFIPFYKKTKFILTIHDLNAISENSDENFQKKYLKKLQKKINRASYIVYISNFTKNEVQKRLATKTTSSMVIYNGISLPHSSQEPSYHPKKKFLFAIGTVLPKKNFHSLIPMMLDLPEYELIIAGTTFHPYAKEIKDEIIKLQITDRVHLIGTISNEEKRWYFENASAFLCPSLLEGFGLPVAEAMSLGIPLFLSNLTSLPEVGGTDAFYFENFTPKHMSEKILWGLSQFNETQKNRLIERSHMFSWEKAADEYLKIYQSLLR